MNKNIVIVIAFVAVSGASFYGGMKYDQSKVSADRQARVQQFGGDNGVGGRREMRGANGGGFASGEVIAKDDKSITLKLRDGGSKIVLVSSSTNILKSTDGSLTDLTLGETVMVNGTGNQDGSITAQSVQIRNQKLNNTSNQ